MKTETFKIGLLSISGMRISHSVPSHIDLSTDKVPIIAYIGESAKEKAKQLLGNSHPWPQWKGLIWEEVIDPDILVEARVLTETPGVANAENKMLEEELGKVAIALQIATSAGAKNWFILAGTEGEAPRSYSQLDHWVQTSVDFLPQEEQWRLLGIHFHGETPLLEYDDNVLLHLTNNSCKIWPCLVGAIRKVEKEDSLRRLRYGILVFHKACSEGHLDFRLPLFVRSLEALVDPSGRDEFMKRVSCWFSKMPFVPVCPIGLFGEIRLIWDLRSHFVHTKVIDLERSSKDHLRLAFECEAIARTAYKEVLLDEDKLKEVKNWWL
jgi:hypothetical protein